LILVSFVVDWAGGAGVRGQTSRGCGVLYRVLGTLEFQAGEHWTPIGAAKWRALLAALALRAGQVVATEQLIDELWGESPPPAARKLVASYVLRLRRLTGDPAGQVLLTRSPGYQLTAARADVDALRFEDQLDAGRRALRDQDTEGAARLLAEALALWRGDALADVPRGPLATAAADRLEELRLTAIELRVEADIRRGHLADLAPELRQLTAAHPLRERLWYHLMSALARDGRQAEALAAYARARAVIAEELGANPGPDLQKLHHALLAGDPAPAGHPASDGRVTSVDAAPRQLPAAVRHFTGRSAELRWLTGLLDGAGPGGTGRGVTISAIGGTAGVGKTALAVHWAHQVAGRFPDGQLYVNLRGYDPEQPVPAADALAGFLRALGVAGPDIPADPEERASRYRSLLAGQRLLVVLDNARSAEQVRPLLPGTPSCAAVVTSRDALPGLVARDGAVRLDLDLLPEAQAVGLLRALAGDRVAADPAGAAALARRCARLPLALRIAAELAAARPAVPLADLARELAGQQGQLDLLDAGGDPQTAVRTVLSWSYQRLDAGPARLFRLAALHPGTDLDAYAAAALTGTARQQAGQALEQLARAHLVQPAGPGRYGMHDLLRAYAGEMARQQETEEQRRAALTRLLDYYLYVASTAMNRMFGSDERRRPRIPPPDSPVPPLADTVTAREWLDAERASLVAAVALAADRDFLRHATLLATTLNRYFDVSGHFDESAAVQGCALRAARRAGDRTAEAFALINLGYADGEQGRYRQATEYLRQAQALAHDIGDQDAEARALTGIGLIDVQLGQYQLAADCHRRALELFRAAGDARGVTAALSNLGAAEARLRQYELAGEHLQEALALYRAAGDRSGEANALYRLGNLDHQLGRYQQAAEHAREAVDLARDVGDRSGEALALDQLGRAARRQGLWPQAAEHHQRALALCREMGVRDGEAGALIGLGDVLAATGHPADARARYVTALGIARQTGNKGYQAGAHEGLAGCDHAAGDPGGADRHWQEALAIYSGLGDPRAREVRARLVTASRAG
jgi:DNA-binding SARP family transcriptional activator